MLIKRNQALWAALAAVVLDLLVFTFLGFERTAFVLNILVLGIACVASITWTPAAVTAFRAGAHTAADKIILSVWGTWTILTLQRIYALALTVWKRPDWLVYSPINSLIVTLIIIAGTYAAYATVGESSAVAAPNRRWTMIASFIGGIIAGGVAVFLINSGLGAN